MMRHYNIAARSAVCFSIVALLVIALGTFALIQMKSIRAATIDIGANKLPSYEALGEINEKMLRMRIVSFRLFVDREAADLAESARRSKELAEQLRKARTTYEALIDNDIERAQFERFDAALERYFDINEKLLALSDEGRISDIQQLLGTNYKALSDQLGEQVTKLVEINKAGAAESGKKATSDYELSISVVLGVMLAAAALTALLAFALTRSIVRPLRLAVSVAETVASGNLSKTVDVHGRDEPAQLLAALKAMQGKLRETLERIAQSSDQLAAAAEELNVVTEDSARGLAQQNQELEQAATAVNEMTAAVDEVARNAVSTSEASKASDANAQQGQEQVNNTVISISKLAGEVGDTSIQVKSLADRVYDISKVLDVIRSIAEQTNLLALNAAIEAARAGDAGRGFAVVADEVRALAHRTQQSTTEIEQMITGVRQGADQAVASMSESAERANATLLLAEAAGQALKEITNAISQISERNLVIASASEEQAQVAREVDRNLVNIRDLAVQTSAGATQTTAASQDLSRLAIDLNTLVGRFTL
ncbi:chemotaxis protein [Stutzerimonas xanthomarina]|uniref:methyl-accepting chemotaxis protein n=1 Tax=Stutzerimonas nitrititolerans TaxID=2482751 RepID=UPI0008240D53|nr:methyl-accepting chemotaxis protein [Stutzerimonas nitrititolerans]MBA1184237.1 methyl-accepting chemotaxis protein [Stutzerimonas stutzeri]OCX20295.1 chemotaxis protein [Stutzerimonas xanthomarina]